MSYCLCQHQCIRCWTSFLHRCAPVPSIPRVVPLVRIRLLQSLLAVPVAVGGQGNSDIRKSRLKRERSSHSHQNVNVSDSYQNTTSVITVDRLRFKCIFGTIWSWLCWSAVNPPKPAPNHSVKLSFSIPEFPLDIENILTSPNNISDVIRLVIFSIVEIQLIFHFNTLTEFMFHHFHYLISLCSRDIPFRRRRHQ